jgi:iron complex transport system substrate-binding protein
LLRKSVYGKHFAEEKVLGGDKEKMKNKAIALMGAIVLCSLFLVALPATAIAAEQDDYVLDIYGNANEDDTIDMRDLTYVKLIFFGKKPETELADAKYDGKINPLDFIQIKLIIVGKEKQLTIVDSDDRIVTVKQPINRIVTYHHQCAETLQLLDVQDKVVGVRDSFKQQHRRFPVISTKPSIGGGGDPDIEAIVMVEPDIVIAYTFWPLPELLEDKLPEHIAVLRMGCTGVGELGGLEGIEAVREEMVRFGYLLDERDNGDRYIEWHDRYVNEILDRVSKIPDDERLRVFIEDTGGSTLYRIGMGEGHPAHELCVMAGGINIGAGHIPWHSFGCESGDVETEWIMDQNPEVILGRGHVGVKPPYEQDDNTQLKAYYDEIKGLPGFEEHVAAVKNDRVYIITNDHAVTPNYPSALATIAKWFYPDLFEDIDPQAIHQEYVDLMGIPFNVYEQGAFVYPPYKNMTVLESKH